MKTNLPISKPWIAILAFTSLLLCSGAAYSQNQSMGIGTNTPNPNAALQVVSPTTNQGLQVPLLTTAQRTAMVLGAADKGMIVFDTDLNALFGWGGTAWGFGGVSNSTTPAISGVALGTSLAGFFSQQNTGNTTNSIYSENLGNGPSAYLYNRSNPSSTSPVLIVNNEGTGDLASFKQLGGTVGRITNSGSARFNTAKLLNTDPNSSDTVLTAKTFSNKPGGYAISGIGMGTGDVAGFFSQRNSSSTQAGIYAETFGTGSAAAFLNQNGSSATPVVSIYNNNASGVALQAAGTIQATGTGASNVGSFVSSNTGNSSPALYASTAGANSYAIQGTTATGWAIVGNVTGGIGAGVSGASSSSNSSSWAVEGYSTGAGPAGYFHILNSSNSSDAFHSDTNGTGSAGNFSISNAANGSAALLGSTTGTGSAVQGFTSTGFAAVYGQRDGSSNGIGGLFKITNASNTYPAVQGETVGAGGAAYFVNNNTSNGSTILTVSSNGTGNVGYFENTNSNSAQASVYGVTNASSLTAYAGNFRNTNTGSSGGAMYLVTYGTGSTLVVNHRGSDGNVLELQSSDSRVARIDKTGKGFFNGGTATSGADVAEMFDVEGTKNAYEPGDVLVISEATDRTMEKSNEPNSTKVAGVYATKPGVTLTELGIDQSLDKLVPLGVIGVIPTKVCGENGAIKRGDLLVTSSLRGHAMKAVSKNGDGIYPSGAILGKALENFDGNGTGLIKVLVNVK